MRESSREKKFAGKAFRKFVTAGILSSLGISISTFVDGIVIGNIVGETGLAAVNIVSPIFLTLNMLGFIIAVGTGIFIARELGQCEKQPARVIFTAGIYTGAIISVLFSISVALTLLFGFEDDLFRFLGASSETLPDCMRYGIPVLISAPVFIMSPILSVSVRSDAAPVRAAVAAGVVVAANAALDIILMMYVFKNDILGASLAICTAEICSIIVCLFHFADKNASLKLVKKRPEKQLIAKIIKNGVGLGTSYFFQAVVVIIFNNTLSSHGTAHVAIFGMFNIVFLFVYALFDGISLSLPTLISTYYGNDKKSIEITVMSTFKLIVVMSAILAALFIAFPVQIASIFGINSPQTSDTVKLTLRFFSAAVFPICLNSAIASYVQSVELPSFAALISLLKNLILLALFGLYYTVQYGVIGVPIAYFLSEITVFIISVLLYIRLKRRNNLDTYLLPITHNDGVPTYEAFIESSLEQVAKTGSEIEEFCDINEVDMRNSFFISLIVEELIVNIIKIGVEDKKTHIIKLKITKHPDEIKIILLDDVTAYNPFEHSLDEVDGSIIRMIKTKAKSYNYQRSLVFNNLQITI